MVYVPFNTPMLQCAGVEVTVIVIDTVIIKSGSYLGPPAPGGPPLPLPR